MAKYRKKPVAVEAEQFLKTDQRWPKNVYECMGGFAYFYKKSNKTTCTIVDGDWIIYEEYEEVVRNPAIFEQTYEKVE